LNASAAANAASCRAGEAVDARDDVMREPPHFLLERLELQHERLDAELIEGEDAFRHRVIAADEARRRSAIRSDMRKFGEGLEHDRLRIGIREQLGDGGLVLLGELPSVGELFFRLLLGLAGDDESSQPIAQRLRAARTSRSRGDESRDIRRGLAVDEPDIRLIGRERLRRLRLASEIARKIQRRLAGVV
jgi:hypothetical protein